MDIETYFESTKVSSYKYHSYEKYLKEKLEEIKKEIIKKLNDEYSIQIDIKNNCIIKNINEQSK
jgi:chaperonin cofactor prefoldin